MYTLNEMTAMNKANENLRVLYKGNSHNVVMWLSDFLDKEMYEEREVLNIGTIEESEEW